MCGITGFIANERTAAESLGILQGMTQSLAHRGPDSDGTWQSADGRVNLGHRRLAIIDLTPSGHQPMCSPDGGHVITYNGEIYNYRELREDLIKSGVSFRGGSDTEVLLQALITWGVEPALRRLNGMFAFAYWNGAERKLWLARDRFGEKPLYYSWQNGRFFFGSELKALAKHPAFTREVDRNILPTYLRFNYVPWPHSIFKNVFKRELLIVLARIIRINHGQRIIRILSLKLLIIGMQDWMHKLKGTIQSQVKSVVGEDFLKGFNPI